MTVAAPVSEKLSEIVAFEKGKPPAQQPYYEKDSELYLTPEYLRGGPATEPIKAGANAVRVTDGDTIVLWDGSNAGEVFRAREGVLSSTMTWLRHRNSFDRAYFYYALKTLEPILKAQTAGSGIPHVDKEVLGNLRVLRFDEREQVAIAAVLATADGAIEQTEALIAKQERVNTGLMQALLSRGVDENGELRSEGTHKFENSTLGRIPADWSVRALDTLVDERITYGIVQAGPHIEDGVPYIRTGDMSDDGIDIDRLLRTSRQIARAYKRSEVHTGDIVFALRATVGKVLPVYESIDGANLTQGTAKISPSSSVDSDYLLWALRTSAVQQQIRLHQKGTTFAEITLGDLRRIEVAIPNCTREQALIAKILSHQSALSTAHRLYLSKMRALRTGLMRDLLSGQRRVKALPEAGWGIGQVA